MNNEFHFGEQEKVFFHKDKAKVLREVQKQAKKCFSFVKKAVKETKNVISKKHNEITEYVSGACILVPDIEGGYRITKVKSNGSIHELGEVLVNNFQNPNSVEVLTSFSEIDFDTLTKISQKSICSSNNTYKANFNHVIACKVPETRKFLNTYLFVNGEWVTLVRKNNHKYLLKLIHFFTKSK